MLWVYIYYHVKPDDFFLIKNKINILQNNIKKYFNVDHEGIVAHNNSGNLQLTAQLLRRPEIKHNMLTLMEVYGPVSNEVLDHLLNHINTELQRLMENNLQIKNITRHIEIFEQLT